MNNLFLGLPSETWIMIIIIIGIVVWNVISILRQLKKDSEVR